MAENPKTATRAFPPKITPKASIPGDIKNLVTDINNAIQQLNRLLVTYIIKVTPVVGTDVQAYSAHLDALDGLSKTDGNFVVTDGTTYVAEGGATARASLGLTIGTDVQAYDAELAAIAGLTSAADALPYFTGSGTASTTTLTSFARSILDDADEATFKATVNLEPGTDMPNIGDITASGLTQATSRLLGRTTASSGAIEELTAGSRLSLTGGSLDVADALSVVSLAATDYITAGELSSDPSDPSEGNYVMWMSDGTGSGDDGDIMIKITAGATTKTGTLVDFSALP